VIFVVDVKESACESGGATQVRGGGGGGQRLGAKRELGDQIYFPNPVWVGVGFTHDTLTVGRLVFFYAHRQVRSSAVFELRGENRRAGEQKEGSKRRVSCEHKNIFYYYVDKEKGTQSEPRGSGQ
jgi:hypothetical protein